MVYRATPDTIWQYKDSSAISQSFLKEVVMKGKTVGSGFTDRGLGSVVDTYLTMPDHVDDFYAAFGGNLPTEALREVLTESIEYLLQNKRLTPDILNHRSSVMQQAEWAVFDQKKKPETRWKSIVEKAKHWWEFNVTHLGMGKEVVTSDDINIGVKIAEYALDHPISRPFFTPMEGRDYYYQKAIYFEHLGVQCKALLDVLVVSHVRRKVVITDIKTIFEASEEQISLQIKKNNYPNQLSFYEVAVQSTLKELGAEGYEIETNFLFIPKDIREQGAYFTPAVWPCTASMKHWARFGGKIIGSRTYAMENGPSQLGVQEVSGWEDALHLYKDCMASGARTFKKPEKQITNKIAESLFFT